MPPEEGPVHESPADASSEEAPAAELGRQILALQREVREIRATLASYKMSLSSRELEELHRQVEPTPSSEPAAAAAGSAPPGEAVLLEWPAPTPKPWERFDWELVLGGNWLARIGVLAVVIGTGFFLKLAFDNNWIGETGRVVLGVLGGAGFLGAGEYWQRRYPVYAQALLGGGVALLYLSIFAASGLYGLIAFYPAVGLLLLISVASAALALRHDSVALAFIGILGAFSAPFIVGGLAPTSGKAAPAGASTLLMAYIIAVDVGVVALATFRNWRSFTLLALLGSLWAFWAWHDAYTPSGLLVSQGSLTIIFLIFVGATTLFHIVWRRVPKAFDQALMVINAAAYFGLSLSYGLLRDDFRPWLGGFTLLLSAFYGGLAYLALARSREHVYLSLMTLGISAVFLTIAIPVQLGGPWVSVAWAVEGVVLMWLSFTLRMWQLRIFSVGVFAILAVRLLAFDTPVDLRTFTLFLNYRMLAFAFGVLALYLAAYLMRGKQDETHEWERQAVFPAFLVGANLLTLWVLSAEVIAVIDSGIVEVTGQAAGSVKSLSLSLMWAVYASIALALGIIKRWRMVRIAGLVLLAVPILKLFLVDSFALEQGYRVAAFMSLGAILLVGGFLYQRYSRAIRGFLFEE